MSGFIEFSNGKMCVLFATVDAGKEPLIQQVPNSFTALLYSIMKYLVSLRKLIVCIESDGYATK